MEDPPLDPDGEESDRRVAVQFAKTSARIFQRFDRFPQLLALRGKLELVNAQLMEEAPLLLRWKTLAGLDVRWLVLRFARDRV